MSTQTLLYLMSKDEYKDMTCGEFAQVYRDMMASMMEDKQYAKQIERAKDILKEIEVLDND